MSTHISKLKILFKKKVLNLNRNCFSISFTLCTNKTEICNLYLLSHCIITVFFSNHKLLWQQFYFFITRDPWIGKYCSTSSNIFQIVMGNKAHCQALQPTVDYTTFFSFKTDMRF